MDLRQAEYLKLLGIQAWCQQEDLPRVQENLRTLKLLQKNATEKHLIAEPPTQNLQEKPQIDSAVRDQPSQQQHDERPNFAADMSVDPNRFRKQLEEVTSGLRVNVAPKISESIAVKTNFVAEAFAYPVDRSVLEPHFSDAVKQCIGCDFSQNRHQVTLPRQGRDARIMVITDIPLKEEMFQGYVLDKSDESFFFKAMNAVGLNENQLYITPFIKCRPPELRDVSDKEWHACFQILKREILEIKPEMIFLLGRSSVKFLLQKELPFESLRRERHLIEIDGIEFPVIISHSPRVYAKNSRLKANFWQDLKFLRRQLG